MTGRPVPVVLVHSWLGPLRCYEPGELLGGIDLEPAVRPPRMNGQRDCEVLLRVMPGIAGEALEDYVDRCAARLKAALARLASIRQFTAQHAPAGWAAHYAPASGSPADLLFLDGLEAGPAGEVLLVFDFGNLDQLVTRLDDEGNEAEVYLRR